MARRRLLTILAASALLTGALAGPAAALDLVEETGAGEVVAEADEATGQVTEAAEAVVQDTVVQEPVAQVTEAAEEVVEAVSGPTASEPQPERGVEATSPTGDVTTGDVTDGDAGTGADVVAAGDVVDAPAPAVMAGGTGLWAQPDGRPPAAPVTAPAEAATDEVEAPMVAPAPAQGAAEPAMLAQPATTPLPDEETPALALVALASLVAAGAWTVREARSGTGVQASGVVTA